MYYENYKKLRDKKGVLDATVARATGIDKATFCHWAKNLYTPKDNKLIKIADYFGVTLEELKAECSKVKPQKENLITKAFNLFKFS